MSAFMADAVERPSSEAKRALFARLSTRFGNRFSTGTALRAYEGHSGTVAGVAYFPDGRRIASASHDGTARIWRVPR